jgi:hypothetical protein
VVPQFVLLHLLSGVAIRRSGRVIGKLTLNLCAPTDASPEQVRGVRTTMIE